MDSSLEDIFSVNNTEEQIEVLEVDPPKKEKKKFKIDLDLKNDKVLLIQIILIGVWALLTTIIYFFGYDLFEPFINV